MGPGGDVSLVVYEDYLDSSGLPKTVGGLQSLAPFFSADYYARKLPVFAGMGGHDLGQPGAATQRPTYRHLLFWVSCALIVVFSALLWRSGRRA